MLAPMRTSSLTATSMAVALLCLGCGEERLASDPSDSIASAAAPSTEAPAAVSDVRDHDRATAEIRDPERQQAEQAALDKAQTATKALGKALKTRLMAAMAEGGAPKAVEVCAADAQTITDQARSEQGILLGRASLKPRNPRNVGPDWVQDWLQQQGGSATAMRIVAGGKARFIAPIIVEDVCLECHGPRDELTSDIAAVLETHYPNDQAIEYAIGDLRGAIWAEAPVH